MMNNADGMMGFILIISSIILFVAVITSPLIIEIIKANKKIEEDRRFMRVLNKIREKDPDKISS